MSGEHHLGQRISYDGAVCTVRYIGSVAGTTGSWLGVEWDDMTRGKHDGSHKGTSYFTCISKSPTAASFVRPSRPADPPQSFIAALHEKYVQDSDRSSKPRAQIYFSTKLAEEVGFDKIWRQQSQLQELKIVALENLRVVRATTTTPSGGEKEELSVAETCPKVQQLDLSRNLFERLAPVVDICSELQDLQKLSINGNRFRNILDDICLKGTVSAFAKVSELALADTMLTWEELVGLSLKFPSLASLLAGTNHLSSLLPPSIDYHHLSSTLTSLNLEFNEFSSISDLASLVSLTALRDFSLKGNNICALVSPDHSLLSTPPLMFPEALEYLDLSYNKIASWDFIDGLTTHFPGLVGLRIPHNPIYDNMGETDSLAQTTEESFMFTIARIGRLKSLNFSNISAADRSNAEIFYLSRITKQIATVPDTAEHTVTALHPRYEELCGIHGRPDVIRREEVNPAFLEARLLTVEFHLGTGKIGDEMEEGEPGKKKIARIPKPFDIYRVKGIAGKLFGLSPLKLRLVWETGDWDPVAGFDEQDDEDGYDDEGNIYKDESIPLEPPSDLAEGGADGSHKGTGRWVKREVELKIGPKLLGYSVDGSRGTIRVESVS